MQRHRGAALLLAVLVVLILAGSALALALLGTVQQAAAPETRTAQTLPNLEKAMIRFVTARPEQQVFQ